MKKSLFISMILSLCFATVQTQAQRIRFVNQNADERFGKTAATTDSTLTLIDSVALEDNEAGVIEATVIGYGKDTAYAVTGAKKVRFNKRRGTLTMGSVIDEQAVVADAAMGTSTFTFTTARNKIFVQIKGKDATNINWYCVTKRRSVIYK